jgi:hypothetical protein
LNISTPIFSQMQMVDASANMRPHAFIPFILDEFLRCSVGVKDETFITGRLFLRKD